MIGSGTFSYDSPPYFLTLCLSGNLNLVVLARLAGRIWSSTHTVLQAWTVAWGFYIGVGDPNSGLHIFSVSTIPMEPSHWLYTIKLFHEAYLIRKSSFNKGVDNTVRGTAATHPVPCSSLWSLRRALRCLRVFLLQVPHVMPCMGSWDCFALVTAPSWSVWQEPSFLPSGSNFWD